MAKLPPQTAADDACCHIPHSPQNFRQQLIFSSPRSRKTLPSLTAGSIGLKSVLARHRCVTPGSPMTTFSPSLSDRVDKALITNPYLTGRTLRFETEGGRVTLRGHVGSWY